MSKNAYVLKEAILGIVIIVATLCVTTWVIFSFSQLVIKAAFLFFDILIFILLFNFKRESHINKLLKKIILGIITTLIITLMLLSIFIISGFSGTYQAETNYDFIVIMGDAIQGVEIPKRLSNRLDKGIEIYKEIGSPIIVTGGKGPGEDVAEADAMQRYLIEKGIPPTDIIIENQSDSTQQNISNVEKILINHSNNKTQPRILFVSSEYHLFRISFLAKNDSMQFDTLPSDTPHALILKSFVREWFAVVKDLYFVLFN